MQTQKYIITEPFKGSTDSIIYQDADGVERVQYSGYLYAESIGLPKDMDLTLEQYLQAKGKSADSVKVLSWAELEPLCIAHDNSMKTNVEPITAEQYNYALDVLPPCRWHRVAGYSVFHVSERITANLVNWYAKHMGEYLTFVDDASITDAQIAKKLQTKGL